MPDAHDLLFRTLADPTRRSIFERRVYKGARVGFAEQPKIDAPYNLATRELSYHRSQRMSAMQLVGAERHGDQHVAKCPLVTDEESDQVAA